MIVVIVAMAIVIAIGGVIIMAIAIVVIMTIVIFLVLVAVFLDILSVLLPASITSFFSFLPSSPSASHTPTCFARRKIGRSPLPL